MALTGIFTKVRPNIGGYFFDAVLEESDELQTDVTRYPIEDGTEGNDHAVNRNAVITMLVASSDNPARAAAALASESSALESVSNLGLGAGAVSAIASGVASVAVGQIARSLPGPVAALAGIGASIGNAAYASGQAATRSASILEEIREFQRSHVLFTLASSKATYANCLITNTKRVTTASNENGLELLVTIEALRIMNSEFRPVGIPAPNQNVSAQASPYRSYGEVTAVAL